MPYLSGPLFLTNDLRIIIICLRKPEVSVERISVCNVIENLTGN